LGGDRARDHGRAAAPDNVLSPARRRVRASPHREARAVPVPAWDLFPVANYWALPSRTGRSSDHLPLLTSRLPVPMRLLRRTEDQRGALARRDPDEVVAEVIALRDCFGVRDFQVEDLNPTVKGSRWLEICERLLARNAGVRF
jgi:hypothetical protein